MYEVQFTRTRISSAFEGRWVRQRGWIWNQISTFQRRVFVSCTAFGLRSGPGRMAGRWFGAAIGPDTVLLVPGAWSRWRGDYLLIGELLSLLPLSCIQFDINNLCLIAVQCEILGCPRLHVDERYPQPSAQVTSVVRGLYGLKDWGIFWLIFEAISAWNRIPVVIWMSKWWWTTIWNDGVENKLRW